MEYKLRRTFRQIIPVFLKVVLLALMAFLTMGSLYVGLEPNDCRILPHVRVGGIDVGGMDPEQAFRVLERASDAVLENTILTAELPEETISLSPADTGVRLQTWKAVLAAYCAGRFGNQNQSIGLLPYLKLDEANIRSVLCFTTFYIK